MTTSNKDIKFSKKLFAFIFSMIVIAGILVAALLTQSFGWAMSLFMCLGIAAIAVMSVKYVGGQAALDKLITLAEKVAPNVGGKDLE